MSYSLGINKENIRTLVRPARLERKQVMRAIQIDPEHLREKNNWYIVDNLLQYFKARKDCRLLSEMLNKEVYRLFGYQTPDYQVVRFILGERKDIEKVGLISPNIQVSGSDYYDVSNLHRLYPEMTRKYGQYTIKKLLCVLTTNEVPGYEKLVEDLVSIYVIDWFCHQLDRNPKNILLRRSNEGEFTLAPLMDNESSFGINGSGRLDSKFNRLWVPSIPYEDESFAQDPSDIDGLDYNIFGILADYPEIVIPLLKKLTDRNFDLIINQYREQQNSQIYLKEAGIDFLKRFIEEKQVQSDKLLRIF